MMPFETDQRLKSYLDTHQLAREQMCRQILATDKRFSNVIPRHPRGGPDGGRDIEAAYRNKELAFGAVGFVNQANDSAEHKKAIRTKFYDDLDAALKNDPKPLVFVFFTNINLTLGEKDDLIGAARSQGVTHAEIFDRERMRIVLDSTDGFAIRFQYLGISLSDSEQASFFARWGDDIQSLIATGFQRIETSLDRILFLQEVSEVLATLSIQFELDQSYPADDIKHFRAFCYLHPKEAKVGISDVTFGSTDRSTRTAKHVRIDDAGPSGIKHGIAGGVWETQLSADSDGIGNAKKNRKVQQVSSSSSVGMDPVKFITISYQHDHSLIRFFPRLILKDLDEAAWMPMLNQSLAEKIKTIHVYANGYKLLEFLQSDFTIDATPFKPKIPVTFSEEELRDPWIRLRPRNASTFEISFSRYTPRRLFDSPKTGDSLAKQRG